MPLHNLAYQSERREHRDQVQFRTRLRAAGDRDHWVLVVNMSPNGLMARCDAPIAAGERIAFTLPGLPPIAAEVRWALGGRIGCEFATSLDPATYALLLPRLIG